MHTKCKTSELLNVSNVQRRMERIALTAPTVQLSVKKSAKRVSRLKRGMNSHHLNALESRPRGPREPQKSESDASQVILSGGRYSRGRNRRSRGASATARARARARSIGRRHHAHPLFAIKIFRIVFDPPLPRT
jgi:hypothetical protein